MSNQMFALHETLELHEISAFKSVCMTKSKTMQVLVSDPQLRELLQADVIASTRQLGELSAHLSNAIERGVHA